MKKMMNIVGRVLQVFSFLLLAPYFLAIYFNEPGNILWSYAVAAFLAVAVGRASIYLGENGDMSLREASLATVIGWISVSLVGAIPFLNFLGLEQAVFESVAGITTTGMSMFLAPENLPQSLLFWRSFMQWIGGLGILTFFVAVVRNSGAATRKLFSSESHKSDPGNVRPSMKKTVIDLWKIYAGLTSIMVAIYFLSGMNVLDSLLHSFSVISTGGFSTQGGSIGAFDSTLISIVTVPFMLVGGTNFVLIYSLIKRKYNIFADSEFRSYIKLFGFAVFVFAVDKYLNGSLVLENVVEVSFTAATLLTSTGYAIEPVTGYSFPVQILMLGIMFVGGSIGSTAGGLKVFRFKVLWEVVNTRIKAYSLPETAINEVRIDNEILENNAVRTVTSLFFLWVLVTFVGTVSLAVFEGFTIIEGTSAVISAISNMGPVMFSGERLIETTLASKIVLMVSMLAGRLEMLPLLAIFNRHLAPNQ
ncbi:MAG: trk system potassium uptake protein TrkH [Colwellia polaris]